MRLKYIFSTFLVISLFFFNSFLVSAQDSCPYKSLGDADCNSVINGVDYSLWLNTQCRPQPPQRCAETKADFNSDGNVDDSDYNIWFANRNGSPANPTATPTSTQPTPSGSTPTPSETGQGIWISKEEIVKLPTSGTAWNKLKSTADTSAGNTSLSTRGKGNTTVLAKALVYARTGETKYRDEVINTLRQIQGTEDGGDVLAVVRRLGTYVIAADLIDFASADPSSEATFRNWLQQIQTKKLAGKNETIGHLQERRPNNWGTQAGFSRAAVAAYLGDRQELDRTAAVFKGWLGDRNSYSSFSYGDLSWQCDESKPVGINPMGCTKQGNDLDGVLPDDQRRCGSFTWPPCRTNYEWSGLQGAVAQAVILHNQGYDVWNWENRALLRAFNWLHNTTFDDGNTYPAQGDDTWQPHIINFYYGTNFPAPIPSQPGKNMGFTDWTHKR